MTRSVYTLLFLLITWILTFQPSYAQLVEIENAFSEEFESPVGIEYSQEGSSLLYIVGWSGKVMVKDTQNPDTPSSIFIDISDRVIASGELGLLGLTFSPDFQNDNTFYLYYTFEEDGNYYSTLARYKTSGGVGDPSSEERLFELLQPQDNHNGGQITFGPDGYLYIALGDGGRSSSQLAQDTSILNGSILRIDVSPETGYDIPPDNPFIGDPSGRDEIYSWGFRNPWRISFDKATGDLWVADVGQKDMETIYIVEKGKNYGWPIVEGTLCYPIGSECDKAGLEMPLYEYSYGQEDTGESITGGYVYRGKLNPSLIGKYIYGDFSSKRIWALEIDHETREVISNDEIALSRYKIPTFGVDGYGEIYVGSWAGGSELRIFRFAPELTLTKAALKSVDGSSAVQLSWETNTNVGIDSFKLYRGGSIDTMELFATVAGDNSEYIDSSPLNGATFYGVRAIETGSGEGELSNPISYYQTTDTVSDSWQLVSLPYKPEVDGVTIPNSISYAFEGSYSVADQLQPGKGYWIRSTTEEGSEYDAKGIGVQSITLEMTKGWNLVGGLIGEIPGSFLIDDGGILTSTPMYAFNGSAYEESDMFIPGNGYWIYTDDVGELTLDLDELPISLPLTVAADEEGGTALPGSAGFDIIEFESSGVATELFVSENSVSQDDLNRYRLPPVAPGSVLDVRTGDGFRLAEGDRIEPYITVRDYPLTVRFETSGSRTSYERNSQTIDVVYELTLYRNGITESSDLVQGESIAISEPYDRMVLQRREIDGEIVRETRLLPSYPNPFNPVTTIAYRLSEQQKVTLTVFDAAGRRIAILVDNEQGAGQYTMPFDASGLASGIYFVRFSAGDVLSTQKLTLIK